jgi:putative endonuclease
VYVIRSVEGLNYVGYTCDLEHRLAQHNSGLSFWTMRGSDWKVVYSERYATRAEAMRRERWLKSGAGRGFLATQLPKLGT